MIEPAETSFILEIRGPQRAAGHVAAPEPSPIGKWVRSSGTRGSTRALPSRGRVQNRRTCGSVGALPSRETGLEPWDT
jgi:hypothetical protein